MNIFDTEIIFYAHLAVLVKVEACQSKLYDWNIDQFYCFVWIRRVELSFAYSTQSNF